MNYKEHINKFITLYITPVGSKSLIKGNKLKLCYWLELKYLYTHLEKFYKAMLTIKGKQTNLIDYFQTLNWLLYKLEQTKEHFLNLTKWKKRSLDIKTYTYLAGYTKAARVKYKKYYLKTDKTVVYYTVITLNPTLKTS